MPQAPRRIDRSINQQVFAWHPGSILCPLQGGKENITERPHSEGQQMLSLGFVIMTNSMKKFILCLFPLFLLITSSCGSQLIATQPDALVTSAADDPCSSQNLPTTVQGLNDLMREFDDASQLASNTPAKQLPDVISNLQRIRRGAEDTQIPSCLGQLKTHQLNHMNLMIQTLIAFVGGASQADLNTGLENARKEHDLYSLEIVRLLGITLAPITATPPTP